MKKRHIYASAILLCAVVFILLRPDLFIKEIFASEMKTEMPGKYRSAIPETFVSQHVYTLVYKDSPAVSFFRDDQVDFITMQYTCSPEINTVYTNNAFESLINTFSGAFEFKNAFINYFYKNSRNETVCKIQLNGNYIIKNTLKEDTECILFAGDFELFLNDKRVIYYKSADHSAVIIKKYPSFIQLYVLDTDDNAVIEKF